MNSPCTISGLGLPCDCLDRMDTLSQIRQCDTVFRLGRYKAKEKKCDLCNQIFISTYRGRCGVIGWKRFCSQSCGSKAMGQKGENHYRWRQKPSYKALHDWIRKHYKIPDLCEHCHKSKKLEFANISKLYKRDRDDWLLLCKSCHVKYDGITSNRTHNGQFKKFKVRNSYVPYPSTYIEKLNARKSSIEWQL